MKPVLLCTAFLLAAIEVAAQYPDTRTFELRAGQL